MRTKRFILSSFIIYLLLAYVLVVNVDLNSWDDERESMLNEKHNDIPFDESSSKHKGKDKDSISKNREELCVDGWRCKCLAKCSCLSNAEKDVEQLEMETTELNQSCCGLDDSMECTDPYDFSETLTAIAQQFWKDTTKEVNNSETTVSSATTSKKKIPKKAETKTGIPSIIQDLKSKCCNDNCITSIPLSCVVEHRKRFWMKPASERSIYINAIIQESEVGRTIRPGGKGPSEKRFRFNGCLICAVAWCTVCGISTTCFYERRNKLLQREKENNNLGITRPRRSVAYDMAKLWFRKFSRYADSMPNSDVKCLPSCLTKLAVYNIYKDQMSGTKTLSRTQFIYGMWKNNYPNVYIPKQSRFTKCTICVHLKEKLQNSRISFEDRARYGLMRRVHITQQMAEREKYYEHGLKGKCYPKTYLSIMIDGMDQSKHNLPHFNVTTKVDSTAYKLKTHVTGVLANARSEAFTFIDSCQWPHDSNLTINILLRVLLFFQQKLTRLPPILYVQMDNCYRECKNKYVLAFLSILVEMKIFKKVKLSFLMVGHTHEDIDQMFSCFSRHLYKNDAKTLTELTAELTKAYTPSPSNIVLNCMFDVKKWMDGHIEDKMSGHVNQHQFKIVLVDGKAGLFYKKWSTTRNWLPEPEKDDNGKDIPPTGLRLVKSLPKGNPDYVPLGTDKIALNRLRPDILEKFGLKLDSADLEWWETFLNGLETGSYQQESWYLQDIAIQAKHHGLAYWNQAPSEVANRDKIDEALDALMAKERATSEILIGGKKPTAGLKRRKNEPKNNDKKKRCREVYSS